MSNKGYLLSLIRFDNHIRIVISQAFYLNKDQANEQFIKLKQVADELRANSQTGYSRYITTITEFQDIRDGVFARKGTDLDV